MTSEQVQSAGEIQIQRTALSEHMVFLKKELHFYTQGTGQSLTRVEQYILDWHSLFGNRDSWNLPS